MGACPSDCGVLTILDTPDQCQLQPRLNTLAKMGFYPCNVSLPDPLDAVAIETLIADGTIVFSQELANFTVSDPTYQDIQVSGCRPAFRIVSSREVTFEDRVAITLTTTSPVATINYYDYDFWSDKNVKTLSLNALFMYCNGDVVIALDENGSPLSFDLKAILNFEAASTPGGRAIEFKAISAIFNGDPLALTNKPAFNVAPDGTVTLL